MKITPAILRQYTELPRTNREIRALLDDVGIEVKRIEGAGRDAVFTLELLANRGDHHCYEGIARELHGRTGGGLNLPEVTELEFGGPALPLRIETDLCLAYTATPMERKGKEKSLPDEVLAPLKAAGIHSVSAAVDATNLSNLELGQPTHAFDLDALEGAIIIRLSVAGERAWPLFQPEPVELDEGTLVIADEKKILAIAGVIGCEESKTTTKTRRLLIESAAFDPVSVRKARQALNRRGLGIHTDSAARFERGSDPSRPRVGAGRVVHLLEKHTGWKRSGGTGRVGGWVDPRRVIELPVDAANAFIEVQLSQQEMAERLSRYGFGVTIPAPGQLQVQVPPHRLWDVEYKADLYEELCRSIGYNNSPSTLPPVAMGDRPSQAESVKERVENVLLGQGFYEVITDGFYGQDTRDALGITEEHPLSAHVQTLNSLDRGYSLLKNNALAQAVELVAKNTRVRFDEIKAFEWTRTFHPDTAAENHVCTERPLLWAIVNGQDRGGGWAGIDRPADPLFLKGVIEEIGTELRLPLRFGPVPETEPLRDLLHPGRQAGIFLGDRPVGLLGEVHPQVLEGFRIKRARPCYFELSVEALQSPPGKVTWSPAPTHQPLVRSLAFALPSGVEAGEVKAVLLKAGEKQALSEVDITDRFDFEQEGRPLRAITFRLVYENTDGQRSAEDVNTAVEALVKAVDKALGKRGVAQRA